MVLRRTGAIIQEHSRPQTACTDWLAIPSPLLVEKACEPLADLFDIPERQRVASVAHKDILTRLVAVARGCNDAVDLCSEIHISQISYIDDLGQMRGLISCAFCDAVKEVSACVMRVGAGQLHE